MAFLLMKYICYEHHFDALSDEFPARQWHFNRVVLTQYLHLSRLAKNTV
jgi:hypothetical protein